MRNLIFADRLEGANVFLKNLIFHDCFPSLNEAWRSLKDSTLRKVWKHILGDFCAPDSHQQSTVTIQQSSVNCQPNAEEVEDVTNIRIPEEINAALSCLCSQPNFLIENSEEWFENEEDDCG